MSNFVIIRHKKLKSVGHIKQAIAHNDRTTMPKNADLSRTHLNQVEGGGLATLKKNLASVTQASTAKYPVMAIEYIVTASPAQIQQPDFDQAGYFKAARAYLDTLVGAGNFVHGAVHYDESNPHAHFIYTPIIELKPGMRRRSVVTGKDADGKQIRKVKEFKTEAGRALNAKRFTGRDESIQLQTDFAEKVGKPFGLRRGIHRSGAKHTEIRAFYGQIMQVLAEMEELRRQLAEREADLNKRDSALSQRNVDLFTKRLALDKEERASMERLQAKIDETVRKLEAREQTIQEQEAAFDEKLEELDRVLDERNKALQEREKALLDNPPNPELKQRSKALDAIVGLLQREQYDRLSPDHQKQVRLAKMRNDERGYNM